MHGIFNAESPLMSGLEKIFDCILLSLCWITACIPVVTIGSACGALYRAVYRSIRKDEVHPMKIFWTTFRENLKNGILVWVPILAVYVFLIADAVIVRGLIAQGQPMGKYLGIIIALIGITSVWAAYCTAYCVRFTGKTLEVLGICALLVLNHPVVTLVMLAFITLGAAIGLIVPYIVIFLPAMICLLLSFQMENVFFKHMRPEDQEKIAEE